MENKMLFVMDIHLDKHIGKDIQESKHGYSPILTDHW